MMISVLEEVALRFISLHENLGARLDAMGGDLMCNTCGKKRPMAGGASYLRDGWPRCCGQIMEWLTAREIAQGGRRPYGNQSTKRSTSRSTRRKAR